LALVLELRMPGGLIFGLMNVVYASSMSAGGFFNDPSFPNALYVLDVMILFSFFAKSGIKRIKRKKKD
jgi:hypothetical protein